MRRIIAVLGLLLSTWVSAEPQEAISQVSGTVFEDRNGNGRHDPGEAGIAGAKLSNGREVVLSDAQGNYRIGIRDGQTLFLIKPPGFRLVSGEAGLPAFWRHHLPQGSPRLRFGGIAPITLGASDWNIPLLPVAPRQGEFELLIFGDPQVKSMQDVDYYTRDIVDPLVGRHAAHLGLSLGDIVDDDLSLFPAVNAVTARLAIPWLHVAGNHDLDFDAQRDEDSLHTFRAHYGPDSFAWEEAELTVIGLDDVVYIPGGQPAYIGGLREDQFEFLQAYLPTLPQQRLLILAVHIPLFQTRTDRETFRRADRERLFAMLQGFEQVLVLSAHSHAQQHVLHAAESGWHGAEPLHEYNVGTACGGFWGGVNDADGIPVAMMADGTPNGYARLRLRDGRYRLQWQAARQPHDDQIALHAPKVLRRGAYPANAVFANVYMGRPDTRVEFRIDAGVWRAMQRVSTADPRVLQENLLDDLADALRGFDRTPQAVPSSHLWRGTLPTDLAAGEHRIEVRAALPWGDTANAQTSYRLDDAGGAD